MKPHLPNSTLTYFWFRVYFGTSNPNELKLAVIKRAYRDFNRTLPNIGAINEREKKAGELLESIIDEALRLAFKSHEEFDCWHRNQCESIIMLFNNDLQYIGFYFGHAQKWINMSLKYCLAIGDEVFPGIAQIINYLHIPIDNVIQDRLQQEYGIKKIDGPWSKINDYEIYMDYQKEVREKLKGEIPIIVEFRLFNN